MKQKNLVNLTITSRIILGFSPKPPFKLKISSQKCLEKLPHSWCVVPNLKVKNSEFCQILSLALCGFEESLVYKQLLSVGGVATLLFGSLISLCFSDTSWTQHPRAIITLVGSSLEKCCLTWLDWKALFLFWRLHMQKAFDCYCVHITSLYMSTCL